MLSTRNIPQSRTCAININLVGRKCHYSHSERIIAMVASIKMFKSNQFDTKSNKRQWVLMPPKWIIDSIYDDIISCAALISALSATYCAISDNQSGKLQTKHRINLHFYLFNDINKHKYNEMREEKTVYVYQIFACLYAHLPCFHSFYLFRT